MASEGAAAVMALIDTLGEEGVPLTNFNVECAPSHAAPMTGRPPICSDVKAVAVSVPGELHQGRPFDALRRSYHAMSPAVTAGQPGAQ
jgi:hypothetical protein